MERTLASQQDIQCRENHIIIILLRKRKPGTEIGLAHSLIFFRNTCYESLSISLLVFLFYVVRHFRLFLLNNFYYDILHLYNIVIPIINSVTSVKLKKAGTWNGQLKYWFKKAVHIVISALQ